MLNGWSVTLPIAKRCKGFTSACSTVNRGRILFKLFQFVATVMNKMTKSLQVSSPTQTTSYDPLMFFSSHRYLILNTIFTFSVSCLLALSSSLGHSSVSKDSV